MNRRATWIQTLRTTSSCSCVRKSRRTTPRPSLSLTPIQPRQRQTESWCWQKMACTRHHRLAISRMTNQAHSGALSRWLLWGEWRAHRLQIAVATTAIALGVALGFAIHLINTAAFDEFSAAARSLSGQSDLHVRTPQATFDESVYPFLAEHEGVELASPVLELDVAISGSVKEREGKPLKILGVDIF